MVRARGILTNVREVEILCDEQPPVILARGPDVGIRFARKPLLRDGINIVTKSAQFFDQSDGKVLV